MVRTIANKLPRNENWIVKTLKELQVAVRDLKSGRAILNNASIDAGGIQITKGGTVQVIDSDGHVVAIIGALPAAFERTDGSDQPGLAFYREDGSTALFLGDLNPMTPPYKQALQLLDRVGNIIIADDTNGGKGLARPYLPMGAWVDNVASGSSASPTTSATYVVQQSAFAYVQHPRVRVDMLVNSTAAGTTGVVGVFDQLGNQIGSDVAVPANAVSFVSLGPVAVRSGWTFAENGYWTLQAKRTAGTGAIGVRGMGFWGVQS